MCQEQAMVPKLFGIRILVNDGGKKAAIDEKEEMMTKIKSTKNLTA